MIKDLRQFDQKNFGPKPWTLCSRSGQVAVVMIVAIAVGIVLFAASINLTLMSQVKTYTMKASAGAASTMASTIASYGQKQYKETMGSRLEYCKKSKGGLVAIITLIVMIVIAIYAPQIALALKEILVISGEALRAAAIMGAVMQGGSILVAATTDPGISDAWNRRMAERLSTTGQFVERGIQAGLQTAVTDPSEIPDLYDFDQDGLYGYPGGDETKPPIDKISRFALYNSKRYLELEGPDTSGVQAFFNAFHEFVVKGGDGWGLWDPVYYPDAETVADPRDGVMSAAGHRCSVPFTNPAYNQRPAECDPCCIQSESPVDNCDGSPGSIGNRATCSSRSPFRHPGNVYQYIYDPTYENADNAFMSFREMLGRDDEHHLYHTDRHAPNWHGNPVNEPQYLQSTATPADPTTTFYLKDTVGYYINYGPSGFGLPNDTWYAAGIGAPKLFPFLYKMADWGVELSTLSYTNYECHYCDINKPADPGKTCPYDMSPEIDRLSLGSILEHSGGWCVDKSNLMGSGGVIPANQFPIVADNVRGIPSLLIDKNVCAINPNPTPVSNLEQYVSGWKRGADRYCSNNPDTEYSWNCPKHSYVAAGTEIANPQCGEAGAQAPSLFPEDRFDEIVYGLRDLFELEAEYYKYDYKYAKTTEGLETLAKELAAWYDDLAEWIEPPCPDPANCPGSVTKKARPGRLWIWRKQLIYFRDFITHWMLGNPNQSPACTGPGATWCVPTSDCGGTISASEMLTFDTNHNSVVGDVQDVFSCLNWNANDTKSYPPATFAPPATGNAEKFARCRDFCSLDTCFGLPRSLIPEFYNPPHWPFIDRMYPVAHRTAFNNCLSSPTLFECDNRCNNTILPSGSPYMLPPFDGIDVGKTLIIENWCGNPSTSGTPLPNACNGAKMGGVTTLNCGANKESCMCSWAGDCASIVGASCGAYCAANPSYCNDSYATQVIDAVTESLGACGDANWDPPGPALGLKDYLDMSASEAEIQVKKFRHRFNFLYNRFSEAYLITQMLTRAIDKFTEFLDGGNDFATAVNSPSENLIYLMINGLKDTTGDLPNFAIYVWQDQDPIVMNPGGQPRWGTGQGYWHAVKVDVRMPRRCEGNCIATDWPKIESNTSGGFFSKKICYKLVNLRGMTKARVVRYDQDKDLRGLVFPGGARIWESRLSNPLQAGDPDPTGMRDPGACGALIDSDLATWLNGTDERRHIGAAFMLNRIPDYANSADPYTRCWIKVHNSLLAYGVMSEMCAEYYFVTNEGFRIKFVPCGNWQ